MSAESVTNQIGPFRILGEIGQGGMGKVYKALQPSVNRVVALKALPQPLENDETAVRRFAQEAETAANLTHPNIVKVWDASVHQPPYYIAMEFLEGGTLADRLASGPLAVHEAVEIMICICSALDHAHERGIIHRDIKPTNIMFDGKGKPVVTDFGIARASEHTRLTASGSIFGTPDFMSPEQAKGQNVDHRSDLYSAAVVFYEMLTGRPPFVNDNPLVTMNQIISNPPPMPSDLGFNIPPVMEAVLAYALAKDPDERYQSGQECAAALRIALDEGRIEAPVRAVQSPMGYPSQNDPRGSQRHLESRRIWLAAALAVVVVLIPVVIWMSMRSGSSGYPPGRMLPAKVIVPASIIGATSGKARNIVGRSGLMVGSINRKADDAPNGCVIGCDPSPGQHVVKGTSVDLVVSSGPSPPPPSFLCNKCGGAFLSQAALNKHIRAVHQPPPPPPQFICRKCGGTFTSRAALNRHIRSAHQPPPPQFTCDQCGATFGSRVALNKHIGVVHSVPPPPQPVEPKYKCKFPGCGRFFDTKGDRDIHFASHFIKIR